MQRQGLEQELPSQGQALKIRIEAGKGIQPENSLQISSVSVCAQYDGSLLH